MRLFIYLSILLSIFHTHLFAQLKIPGYNIELGSSSAIGRQTPFWLLSDHYGLLTPDRFNDWVKAEIKTNIDTAKRIDFDYCLELVDRYSSFNTLYINQGYIRLKLLFTNLQIGSIEEKFGNQDNDLSSGGLLWSGNARPMPKISIIVPKYTKVPFTSGWFEFKGGISHGWFNNNQFTKNVWLHHKYGYIQFGGKLPVHIHYGMHHYAQWGGFSSDSSIGQLPNKLSDFQYIFFAKSKPPDPGTPWAEWFNKLGNHIGSRNFGLDVDLRKYQVGAYWQTIFEDGSGKAYRNISDGLWGLYFHIKDKNKIITGIVYEFIKTTDQSGPINETDSIKPDGNRYELGGNDNYFNNGIYRSGWSYYNMTIGTPLITSPSILNGGNASDYIRNNKIKAHHIGIEGGYKKLSFKLFYTYSMNFGTNFFPINNKTQHSLLISTSFFSILPWKSNLGVSLGLDFGKMYGNNAGLMMTLSKAGIF